MSDLRTLASQFVAEGEVAAVEPLGKGNINSTFLVTVDLVTAEGKSQSRFVLQRINAQVFRRPEQVIQNMVVLGEHLRNREKIQTDGRSPHWQTPQIIPTTDGNHFWQDEARDYWRAISFIENSQVLETIETHTHAREVGYGLAMFHRLISNLPVENLADTIEGFHITPTYLTHYQTVLKEYQTGHHLAVHSNNHLIADPKTIRYCMEFVEARRQWASVLERAKAEGHLQLRPIHGDPKVNNIMLNQDGQAVSLIDLDTLKPGLVHYDIGDCLRSSCNRLGEETEDWKQVTFDTSLAKAMLEGYFSLAHDFLTEYDYLYIYDAIRLIAFELGLRFFTDYLVGNVYFKVEHPTHNLMRALVQFKLTESIETQAEEIVGIIEALRQ
ncbi:Phosphotransferase enzyme family, putative [Synechococcus sp. PCC 7335]|uniref:phosphotransferase enzyme family protein n=1 Tax=Synechococcus sp. (strain ATCC 29403 / PCC 7335) TaxID=91464 RepID=UPI00017EBBEC|nr:aminoglycoside phosphotransferase family protein [Synechococcus sp. PCC 7335]EDX85012.1 Phosphotransferase enzyme family, putative [Synechococcus sp. PCC 7335]